jgi:transglutaminase-like putative cysteine protease
MILKQAEDLMSGGKGQEEITRRIFYFIRDRIRYDFRPKLEASEYRASSILKERRGFCTMKAILFCALARACGIPAGLHFYHIVDHTLPNPMVKMLRTNTLYHHGIGALWLEDGWYQYDATLDRELINMKQLEAVEFAYQRDCLMPSETRNGGLHIEYIEDIGLYNDVSFAQIKGWLREGYPHLYRG